MTDEKSPHQVEKNVQPMDLDASHAPSLHFPEEAWTWFTAACRDMEIPLDDGKRAILESLYSHLVYVNEFLNLTRITSPLDYLKFHVFDSLTVQNLVGAYTKPGDRIVDLGSGGGYPGLPLMTWLPDRRWTLVDSRPKKVDFLSKTLKLTPASDAEAKAFRGREVASHAPELYHQCQLVTARAVGKGTDLLADVTELLAVNGIFMLLKGPSYPQTERVDFLRALPAAGFDLLEEHQLALDEQDPDRWVILTMKTEETAASGSHHGHREKPRKRDFQEQRRRRGR